MRPLVFLLASVIAIATAACSRQPAPCTTTSLPWPTLRIAVANPRATPTAAHQAFNAERLTEMPLVQLDPQGRIIAGLARAWQRTDPRTWTFTLRPNLRSHNGQPLTAERIRARILKTAALPFQRNPVWRDLQAIETTDSTLVFRFARPVSMLPEAFVMLELTTHRDAYDLSAGPWRITRETPEEIDFEAFPPPASGEARLAHLHVTMFPSAHAAWASFLRNETDFLYEVPPNGIATLAQNPDIRIYGSDHRRIATLGFNLQHRWLRDVRVRQAINLAIDRETLVRRFYGGNLDLALKTKPLVGPFSPEYWATHGIESPWRYDLPAARALLKAATQGHDEPIEIRCLTSSEFPDYAELATVVEAQLQRVHIRVRLEPMPIAAMQKRVEDGDFDTFVVPGQVGYADLQPYLFWHGGGRAVGFYRESGYTGADAAFDRLYGAESPEVEQAGVREVVQSMYDDPPAAFLAPVQTVRAVRSTWRVPADEPDIRRSLSRWQFDPPCKSS